MQENAKRKLTERIISLVQPIIEEAGLELVELQYRSENIGWVLRLIIFKPGGVSLDDCALVSRQLSYLLDVENIIPQKYHLEVSSPGLDRPLRNRRDFERNIGAMVGITIRRADESFFLSGKIAEVRNDEIALDLETGREWFDIKEINKAKLIIDI